MTRLCAARTHEAGRKTKCDSLIWRCEENHFRVVVVDYATDYNDNDDDDDDQYDDATLARLMGWPPSTYITSVFCLVGVWNSFGGIWLIYEGITNFSSKKKYIQNIHKV